MEYYLKATGRAYRVTYRQEGANFLIDACHACGSSLLPNGDTIPCVDASIDAKNVLVDQLLGNLTVATVADYRTAGKAQLDASW